MKLYLTKILVISEKPDVTRTIKSALEPNAKTIKKGKVAYYEGQQYTFASARGHLLTLAEPAHYDEKYKKWTWETLPIIPKKFNHVVIKGCKQEFDVLKKLLTSSNFSFVVNACDAAREGELIFRRIYSVSNSKLPVKRLWISTLTDKAIKEGFNNLIDSKEYNALYETAHCRALFDWELGINASRAMSLASNAKVNIGRVMTPTLNIVATREKEIQNFKPTPYYVIRAIFGDNLYGGNYINDNKKPYLTKKEEAKTILNNIQGKKGTITSVKDETKKIPPPLLFNLTDLQRESNEKYGYSANKALEIAQGLYEKHKIISYPRTESKHLSKEMNQEVPEIIKALTVIPKYGKIAKRLSNNPEKIRELFKSKRYVDDLKVTDHYAIIPTSTRPKIENLSKDEKNIYLLIVTRFLAIFFPPAKYSLKEVLTEVDSKYTFLSKGRALIEPSWKIIIPDKKTPNDLPASLEEGQEYTITDSELQEKETQPPKRHTDATLLQAMQNPKVKDKNYQEILKDVEGLGTPATRAGIIEKLINIKMLERKKKYLIPTEFGTEVVNAIPVEQIKSPELTAEWEKLLRGIENNELNYQQFMKKMLKYIHLVVNAAKESQTKINISNKKQVKETDLTCPLCQKQIIENNKAFNCSDWKNGCKFTVWKKTSGANVDQKDVKDLIEKGRSKILSFTWKNGKKGKARLTLDKKGAIGFDFSA